jgi:hypothetical protein
MLSNTLTLNDGTTDHDYDLVSREGMNSIRRETGVDSHLASSLVIKNTVDLGNSAARNRHFVALQGFYEDTVDNPGILLPWSVHVVISRHKLVPDSLLLDRCVRLADFLDNASDVTDVLVGGN